MSRVAVILTGRETRERVARWVMKAPCGTRLEMKAPKRTTPQNSLLWVHLTTIARQVTWHGVRLTADDFKLIFLDALKAELRIVPNLNGDGFVNLGRSSSDLSKAEFADLITLIQAWAAEHDVDLGDPQSANERRLDRV